MDIGIINIFIIDFMSITKGKLRMTKDFVFEDIIYNIRNGQRYSLIYETFDSKTQQQGWWNHDGLKFKGNLIKPKSLIDVLNKRPRILFYKKLDS